MKLSVALFLLLLAMGALVAGSFLIDEPANSHGFVHPELASMEQGGPGAERHGSLLWLGWGAGMLEVALFVALLGLGARKRATLRGLGRPLALGGVLYALTWSLLVLAYRSYMLESGGHELWLAFPAPTAIMLFALWPVPLVFLVLYVAGFQRWIFSPEDRREFEALLERSRRASRESA